MELINSKPCSQCINIIKSNRFIKRVIYSDENGNLISINTSKLVSNHISLYNRRLINHELWLDILFINLLFYYSDR